MGYLRIEQFVVGPVMTNCYIGVNTQTKEMFFIDPGDDQERLTEKVKQANYQPVAILLTHGHFDHAGVAKELAERYQIPIYAHKEEKETLINPSINLSIMGKGSEIYQADCYVFDQEVLSLAGFEITVIHTPGHTTGGCCFYLKEEQVLFSGDTLFCESVGRSDFPGGSMATLTRSIKEKLFVLPPQVEVYPGHNEATTIGWEKEHNPFV